MTRLVLAFLLIVTGVTLCSCSEPSEGVKKPQVVTPPPERLEIHATTPGGQSNDQDATE